MMTRWLTARSSATVAGAALLLAGCAGAGRDVSSIASLHIQGEHRAPLLLGAGASLRLQVDARDARGEPVAGAPVVWTSESRRVARIDADGVVTALTTGTATITARAAGAIATAEISVREPPALLDVP